MWEDYLSIRRVLVCVFFAIGCYQVVSSFSAMHYSGKKYVELLGRDFTSSPVERREFSRRLVNCFRGVTSNVVGMQRAVVSLNLPPEFALLDLLDDKVVEEPEPTCE